MASQLNLLLHTYPKLRSSTPSSTMKTTSHGGSGSGSMELPFLMINQRCRSSWSSFQIQTRQRKMISPRLIAACSISEEATTTTDVPAAVAVVVPPPSWVETYIPEKARPYAYLMRLHKFTAGPLITMPCLWSIAFTTQPGSIGDAKMLALFLLVGIVNRGILCTINDILDRDFDAKVKRTSYRPLASGALTLFQALSCLALQTLLCYGLLLPVNALSRNLWVASLVLGFTYPLMKRVTFWPQAYLGLVVNSINFSGWAAVKGGIDPRILIPLCASGFFWTIFYDTIYSHQDKVDDAKIGVKSTALFMGNSTKKWLSGLGAATIGALALTGSLASIGWPYYASLVAASIHLGWQILSVDLDSSADCFSKFNSNVQLGAIVLCGILLGRLYQ